MAQTAKAASRKALVGSPYPRIAPPRPLRTDLKAFRDLAARLGLLLYPWQETAARYLTAKGPAGPLYREVAVIVARQNGKTELLLPLIVSRLLAGQAVTHAAQRLWLPGRFHERLAEVLQKHWPELIPLRRGISWRAGQESIRLTTGGFYQIVAASGGAPRGSVNDLVVIDELREMDDPRFLAGIKPTTIARPGGQLVYVSNAGIDSSVLLNSVRARAEEDPTLAYLEWSASPEYADGDERGWLQANPAIGHNAQLLDNLRTEHRAAELGGTMADFETEHLCRYQVSLANRLVAESVWKGQDFAELGIPQRAYMAVNMDPNARRASAVIAWSEADGRVALDVHDASGDPIDTDLLGPDLQKLANANRAAIVAYDPYTDADLVRHLRRAKPINGREYASASEKFVRLAHDRRLRVHDPKGLLAEDLRWTIRRGAPFGTYMADRADNIHPITAVTAAIRATWLASAPVSSQPVRIF